MDEAYQRLWERLDDIHTEVVALKTRLNELTPGTARICHNHEKALSDHDSRLRALERTVWKAAGALALASMLAGLIGGWARDVLAARSHPQQTERR